MRIRGSRPLRNGPETARSISVGRFRPVAVSDGIVAEFRGPNQRLREIWPEMARPPRLERGTPGLEGRCSIQLSYGRVPSVYRAPSVRALARMSGCQPVDDPGDILTAR